MRKAKGCYIICLVSVVVWLMLSADTAFSGCTSWEDNNKPVLSWTALLKDFILYYNDNVTPDGDHTPEEPISGTNQQGYTWAIDNSCWIATGSNISGYEGCAPSAWECYDYHREFGGGPSPGDNPFGADLIANSGDHFTFDDKGHPHWVLKEHGWVESMANGPYIAPGNEWRIDPIAWCKERVDANHPVGLGIEFANGNRHYITLWDIEYDLIGPNLVYITDSDDVIGDTNTPYYGLKTYEHSWDDATWKWTINDYKWARAAAENVLVDYIVCWSQWPSAVEETTWGKIKSMYR